MCASGSIVKNLSDNPDEPNALLDAPIMIPERANGSNKSKETKDTTEVDSMAGRVVHTGVHACVSESWQTGKIEMSTKIIAYKDKRFQHYR